MNVTTRRGLLTAVLDGRDPAAALAGRSGSPHMYLYWRRGNAGTAIRMGRYTLIREKDSPGQEWQLFDLQADAGESNDLRTGKRDLAEQLKAEYERWMAEMNSAHENSV